MKLLYLLVPICFFCVSHTFAKVRYDGYKVLRLTPQTQEHLQLIEKLKRVKGLMFWRGPSAKIGLECDIMVPPHLNYDFLTACEKSGIQKEEYIDDVQKLIDTDGGLNSTKGVPLNWDQYAGLNEVYDFLEEQASLHSDFVTLLNIGKSFEGRDLKVLKIAKGPSPRPGIWIDANIHAREWISGAVVTFMINQLLNGQNQEIKSWADDFDFYLMPIANPDGFEYSHTVDRIWRKTRSTTHDSACFGVDANRNFGFRWQTGGSSKHPCDGTYAGPAAFSEPETLAISQYYDSIAQNLVGFISLHSYGQYILLPYGVHGVRDPLHFNHIQIATKIQRAISKRYGTTFRSGSIVDVLYTASGGSIDWVRGVHDTKLTFVFELRDTGSDGFLLPANQIVPSSLEFLDGFQVIVDELRRSPQRIKNNAILKMRTPMRPISFDSQTFGSLPSRNAPIASGFQRH